MRKEEKEGQSYKDQNNAVGKQGEHFCRALYYLMENPNGDNRPDLISVNGSYNPRLAIETKIGKGRKGVLTLSGLIYGLKSHEDYEQTFGERLVIPNNPNHLISGEFTLPQTYPVASYLSVIHRTDKTKNWELRNNEFGAMAEEFGDHFIVPIEFGFYTFIIGKAIRHKITFQDSLDRTKSHIKDFYKNDSFKYGERSKNFMQNIYNADILSIFMNDKSLLRSSGAKRRVSMLEENYHDLEELIRIQMLGPDNHHIYVMAKSEHEHLFDVQFRERIASRRKIVENLTHNRRKALKEMRYETVTQESFNAEGFGEEKDRSKSNMIRYVKGLTPEKLVKLKRLLEWIPENERKDVIFTGVHPDKIERIKTDEGGVDVPF